MKYIIGTRGSKLALAQANDVCARLKEAYPKEEFEIRIIRTKGDLIQDRPLSAIGDKGLFVKEIEQELLNRTVDIGVHSMKDMPAFPAEGLLFTKAWKREDPRDVLVLREKSSLAELPEHAVIGTGSKRREFQLKRLRPDLRTVNIRGNVDTRIRKMEEEKLDGILLAAAGLHRLNMWDRITQYLDTEEMIPAPAQGILALEIRTGEKALLQMLNALSEEEAAFAAEAERGFLQEIGGSCHVPVGAVCEKKSDGSFLLRAMFGNATGEKQAYTAMSGKDPKALAWQAAAEIRRQMAGTVYLVGAGPGDPELITVKGLNAVRQADCIVYDRLASCELLEEAKPGCEQIYVGKESHNHTMKQEEINLLLVRKSMEYRTTVRLKGGDVYVFGRGGEEGLCLREHGVPFEVIPGVTSAIAGLAYAGIPITHRGLSSGFHVVTAHSQNDTLAEIDFKAMASAKETCVFLMGLSKVAEISDRLMQAGMSPEMGAAVISCATTPEQRVCLSDLGHIAEEVRQAKLCSPALIVAGEVVSLQAKLDFMADRPLLGRRYLIPKIGEKPLRLRRLLERQGAVVDEVLVGRIADSGAVFTAEEMRSVDWLVFTSKNGVEAFFRGMKRSGLDMRQLAGCKVAAIGEKTAKELQKHGLYADLIPEEFHSGALSLALKNCLSGGEMVWYLKAKNADSHLKEELEGRCRFKEITVYENQEAEPDLQGIVSISEYDGILCTCASSAERLLHVLGKNAAQDGEFYSIGQKTTAYLKKYGANTIFEAKQSDYEGLAKLCADRAVCQKKGK